MSDDGDEIFVAIDTTGYKFKEERRNHHVSAVALS
jgi:hypothetical protein